MSVPLMTDLHHVAVLVTDLERALHFYSGVLGLQREPSRPSLAYPGAWLQLGGRQLHLLQLPSPDPVAGRPGHAGHDRHLALAVRDLDVLRARLERADIPYTRSRSGRRALFCRDPDGNGLELLAE